MFDLVYLIFQINDNSFRLFIFTVARFKHYHWYPYSRVRRRQNAFKSKNSQLTATWFKLRIVVPTPQDICDDKPLPEKVFHNTAPLVVSKLSIYLASSYHQFGILNYLLNGIP